MSPDVAAALEKIKWFLGVIGTGLEYTWVDERQAIASLELVAQALAAESEKVVDARRQAVEEMRPFVAAMLATHDADALDQRHTAEECADYAAAGFADCRVASQVRALLLPPTPRREEA